MQPAQAPLGDEAEQNEVMALVMVIGDRLGIRHQEIVTRMTDVIAREVDYLNDPELMAMLRASVDSNISTILHIIRNEIPLEHVQPITAATEYALRLAQRGVPGASLRRAYHFGSDDLRTWIFEEVEQLDCEPDVKLKLLHHLAGFMHKYIDWITQLLLEAHEDERQRWIDQGASETASLVAKVLARQPVSLTEFATRARYRLDQVHVGAVCWIDGANSGTDQTAALGDLALRLAVILGCGTRVLFTAVDRGTVWVWFGRGREAGPVDVEVVRSALQDSPGARVSLGLPIEGIDGFRRSHDQAEAAKSVAIVSSSEVTHAIGFGERGVPIMAMLVRDLAAARRWVYDVLGPLARDGEAEGRTRETLRVFLGTGGSYAQTSERLLLHRNSVKYRIRKAEDERGRPLEDDRLDLELALQVCHFLGDTVLVPLGDPEG
ncbi:polyketide synthase regulator [Aeromicrobium sp. A1-2]|uniref:PucR family transcriptional regulator n=1 Tax=Aeromicrobium sp. A1-2 TaxID=2107713 RepID=UPI000E51E639|nr:helix-turn-helix domain-containing protein [Aeromicrobium sp. A1-2]AXT83768.1 polyketide synthase regulator [Aeromicrobium sp. A1-2]